MARHIHYEIFRRQGLSASWSLVEVRDDREEAVQLAQHLISGKDVGIKVVKETFDDVSGAYLTLKIFEHGEIKKKSKLVEDDLATSPCFKPDDLYSYHARKTIAALLGDFLSHHGVTVTELQHRADLLERLEASNTLLQHAIQRIAVTQAADSEEQMPKIVRSLRELTSQAMHRVYRDAQKRRFGEAKVGSFITLAEKYAASHEGRYLLNGTIARYLKSAKGWDEKVARLMTLMAEAKGESAGAKLLFACVDSLISEVLNGSAGLKELIGAKENHGAALMGLIKLFLGRPSEGDAEGLSALTREFAADALPEARTATAQRIVAEIRSFKRLCPKSLEDELRLLRQIANLVVMGVGKYLSHDDLVAAFVLRSHRLVTNECLGPYLSGITPDVKLQRILFVEENIIGADNKRRLAEFVTPVITGPQFEEFYQSSKLPVAQRLQQIESLRQNVLSSGFQENQRSEIADALDRIATGVESRCHFFDTLDRKPVNHSEKVVSLLNMMASATFTAPRLATKARQMVVGYLMRPGFLRGYIELSTKNGGTQTRDAAVAELTALLDKAGVTLENGIKSIAA